MTRRDKRDEEKILLRMPGNISSCHSSVGHITKMRQSTRRVGCVQFWSDTGMARQMILLLNSRQIGVRAVGKDKTTKSQDNPKAETKGREGQKMGGDGVEGVEEGDRRWKEVGSKEYQYKYWNHQEAKDMLESVFSSWKEMYQIAKSKIYLCILSFALKCLCILALVLKCDFYVYFNLLAVLVVLLRADWWDINFV